MATKQKPKVRKTREPRMKVVDADNPLTLRIAENHVKRAKCGKPAECVIAQALQDHFGCMVDGFQVGQSITKIYNGDKVVRYSTPANLSKSLDEFDRTGKWNLPPGDYTLRPLAASYRRGNRWDKKKNSGKKPQSKFRGTAKTPTRKALTVCQLQPSA